MTDDRTLVLSRFIPAQPETLYRCWTEPSLLTRWFTPPPWQTIQAELDVRPGGTSSVLMQGPDGQQIPNRGVYLAVEPNRRIVFTDAYTDAWVPSSKPFMTVVLTFDPEAGGTRYAATVHHWTMADKAQHEAMGFEAGWGIATDQLAALAATV